VERIRNERCRAGAARLGVCGKGSRVQRPGQRREALDDTSVLQRVDPLDLASVCSSESTMGAA
jgi:hypothetical protein